LNRHVSEKERPVIRGNDFKKITIVKEVIQDIFAIYQAEGEVDLSNIRSILIDATARLKPFVGFLGCQFTSSLKETVKELNKLLQREEPLFRMPNLG
jgi:hypothetical protein